MTTWIQLTKDKSHSFYRVPIELAEADDNNFFGTEHHPLDIDGPWLFLAFLRNRDQPRVFTFQIYTIEAEALEFEGFNPLAETCGALSLNRQALADLASLLLMYAQRLPPVNNISQKMFEQIEDSRQTDLHLHPEWFPNSRDYCYYQTYDPLGESRADSIATILVLSTGQCSQPPSRLYFKIAQFSLDALQDPSFDPLDYSLPRINLDRSGMQELAGILEVQLANLVDS